ncbi:NAD(P)-binding protein [Candidatus Micrarchaeota archaeon]|nr:NAD(P)-binding protein [Candidatus Micrarchaeota archaeon]
MIKILGAGLSGLSAAINLKRGGKDVLVMERLPSVGMHIHPNYQALRTSITGQSLDGWFSSMGLRPKGYRAQFLSKMVLETPNTGIRELSFVEPVPFVLRGGKGSLEWALYNEAREMGVEFEFNTRQKTADIVATGHMRCDAAAYGEIYEVPEFPEDRFFYMHNDRHSPRGWYCYIVPMGGGLVEVVNCVSQPNVPRLREYYSRLVRENSFIRGYIGDKEPASAFGGFGSVDFPATAKKGGQMLVGEAAGFQDVCRGFGISYALESGRLAARSILDKKDYNSLWRKSLGNSLKKDFARRLAVTIAGDRAVEWYFRKFKNNDTVDYSMTEPNELVYNTVGELACRAEILKRKLLGYW